MTLALLCLAPGLSAQTKSPAPTRTATQKDPDVKTPAALANIHIQSPLVQAPVTVVDPSGQFVDNLSQSDFRVLDNGVPQHIAKFGLAQEPVALVVVVENDRGVAPLLGQVKPLGVLFSDLLVGHKGQAAVITFDDSVDVAQNFSSDPAVLANTLAHVTSDGSKVRLNDALGRAILMLTKRPSAERRVIIALCEGLDRGSETTSAEIIRAATSAEISIYGLQFSRLQAFLHNQQEPEPMSPQVRNMALPAPQERPQTPTSVQTYNNPMGIQALPLISGAGKAARGALPGKNLIETYAAYTGGTTYTHWKAKDLQKQLTRIALEVNSQYVLAYVPSTLKQAGFHQLKIQVTEPKLKVRTRAGYFDAGNMTR